MGLWEALSNFRNSIVDEKSKIKSGLGGLEDIIRKNVKIDGIKNGLERLKTRIEENVEIAKYIPYALMAAFSLNTYGRIGYYGSQAFIYSRMAKGNADAGHLMYGKAPLPLIVGAITGVAGLVIGILLGDAYSLWHHNAPIGIPQLSRNDTNPSCVTNYNNSTIPYLQHELQNDTAIINTYKEQLQNDNTIINQDNQTITNLEYLLNQDNQTITNLEYLLNQYKNLLNQGNQTITNIEYLLNQYNQTQQLFGNSSSDFLVIQVNSVNINNGTAYIQGISYPSDKEVTLEIPLPYVENGNLNISNFYNIAQKNGWNTYIVLDRADLQYLTLNNQNGTTVIDIQPNEPLNIGEYATPVNASTLYNVLNHQTKYDMVIQDSLNNSLPPYDLWGYNSNSSVVINFPNNYLYYLAKEMIDIADQMITSTNNSKIINSYNLQNPTHSGIIDTYSIFSGTISGYGRYGQYNVGKVYIPLIVLKPQQGNTIPDAVSS